MGARPVWRVRDRASFDALRRSGRRCQRGPLSVVWVGRDAVADDAQGGGRGTARPAVAFAIGRSVGGAVARNRLRRRLRAVVDEVVGREGPSSVPAGTYLISARGEAAGLTPAELRSLIGSLFADVAEIADVAAAGASA